MGCHAVERCSSPWEVGHQLASPGPSGRPLSPIRRWACSVPATAAEHRGMDRLRALNEQDGFFSRADALAEGYDDRTIQRTIRSGTWRRVRNGAYSFTDLWPPTEQDLHRVRGRAAARKLRDHVALS